MSGFHEAARDARKVKGWTLLQLSRELYARGVDLHPSQLSRIERGLAHPGAAAEVLAQTLGIAPPAAPSAPIDASLGERLRAFRKAQRMTLTELAAKLRALGEKADVSDLSKYERGLIAPGTRRLQALAGALGVAVGELLGAPGDDADRSLIGDLSPDEAAFVRAWRDGGLEELMLWCAANAKRLGQRQGKPS